MENKFDFNDILIQSVNISYINSRKEINPYYDGFLPLITAPMDTVISTENEKLFYDLKVNTCLPRNEVSNYGWTSYSLNEINHLLNINALNENGKYLIDIANGHMSDLLTSVKRIKKEMPNITLMVGNIANPMTYVTLSEAGADYIRVGIGNGGACWVGDTLISTNKGLKKIKDIEINDLVLTHTGNYEPVVNTISYNNNEELYDINGEICTKNHEIYVTLKENVNLINETNYKDFCFFISAELLDVDKHLIISWDMDIND